MKTDVEILSEVTNCAVVRLPERRFPGVVVQGDTLKSWELTAHEIVDALEKGDFADARETAAHLYETLQGRVREYEEVLVAHRIDLPYVKEG